MRQKRSPYNKAVLINATETFPPPEIIFPQKNFNHLHSTAALIQAQSPSVRVLFASVLTYLQTARCSLFLGRNHLQFWIENLATRPRGIRHMTVAARFLRLRVRIFPGARMFVSCDCCVLSGTDLCDGPIPRPGESYRVRLCPCVCDQVQL
jgi:hypothetical protein